MSIPAPDFSLQELRTEASGKPNSRSVESRFADEISTVIDRTSEILGETDIVATLRQSYVPGAISGKLSLVCSRKSLQILALILLEPSDPELHRIAEPILHSSIEQATELDEALLARGKDLERAGYHQQVKVTESSTLLFAVENGSRTVIHRKANHGSADFQIGSRRLKTAELLRAISDAPEEFSANALAAAGDAGLSVTDDRLCGGRRRSRLFRPICRRLPSATGPRDTNRSPFLSDHHRAQAPTFCNVMA